VTLLSNRLTQSLSRRRPSPSPAPGRPGDSAARNRQAMASLLSSFEHERASSCSGRSREQEGTGRRSASRDSRLSRLRVRAGHLDGLQLLQYHPWRALGAWARSRVDDMEGLAAARARCGPQSQLQKSVPIHRTTSATNPAWSAGLDFAGRRRGPGRRPSARRPGPGADGGSQAT
jgi:hypothetical protein